jgi:hypothetical protein
METQIGKVTHYFNRINVAVLEVSKELKVGDMIHILGRLTDITQQVGSMEIEHQKVQSVVAGAEVALKVIEPVHAGDAVFLVR